MHTLGLSHIYNNTALSPPSSQHDHDWNSRNQPCCSVSLANHTLPLFRPLSWPKLWPPKLHPNRHPMLQTPNYLHRHIAVIEERNRIVAVEIPEEEITGNNNNKGNHGITHLGNNGVLGIIHLALTQPQIKIDQIMVLSPNKVEFLGPNLSRLLSMLILPTLLTLKVFSAPSILLSQTPLGTWTPEPPLT